MVWHSGTGLLKSTWKLLLDVCSSIGSCSSSCGKSKSNSFQQHTSAVFVILIVAILQISYSKESLNHQNLMSPGKLFLDFAE